MSFGGSVFAMITSLKNNANLVKRKAFKSRSKDYVYEKTKTLKYRDVSKEQLSQITNNIREEARSRRKVTIIISSFLGVIFLTILTFALIYTANNSKEFQRQRVIEMKKREEALREEKEKLILHYLNSGYEWINKGHYKNAKFQFYEAHKIDSSNYQVILANTTAYVYDCIENDNGCKTAEELLDGMIKEYGRDEKVKDLIELLEVKKIK